MPQQYHVKATMSLPYAGIIEPVEIWYDAQNNQQRVDYYNGMDSYVFRGDLNMTWQRNPVVYTTGCFATPGPVDLQSYFPDMAAFALQPGATQVNNVMVNQWTYVDASAPDKASTYDMYLAVDTGLPVQYRMMGYDSLLGSHYDEYVVDYSLVEVNPTFPTGTFGQPAATCGDFPGPGFTFVNPLLQAAQMFPGTRVVYAGVHPEFQAYMNTYGKSYSTETELRQRERRFLANKAMIESHNRKGASFTMKMNHMADLTREEMNARRGVLSKRRVVESNNAHYTHVSSVSDISALPPSMDWRQKGAVNVPQDQGVCGSCWSFGATGTIEGAYYLKYGRLEVFSQQELMDCSWPQGNNACDGGEDFRSYQWIMSNGGISFKSNYGPYLMADAPCRANATKPDAQIASYVNITMGDETALMDALVNYGPISVSIDASHDSLSFYASGVYVEPLCGNKPEDMDHAVLLVGYGTDPQNGPYWIIKNSWSTHWGDEGYVKISRVDNMCGVETSSTYVTLQ